MRSPVRALALAAFCLSCDGRQALRQAADDGHASFARESLALLLQRDLDGLRGRFSPELARVAPSEALARVVAEIPAGTPSEPTLVGYRYARGRSATITWQYRFPTSYLLGRVQLDVSGPRSLITGVNLQRIPDSLDRINAFRFSGKTWRHFAVLAMVVLVPSFILVSVVTCIRTRGQRRKWLWVPLMALGVGAVRLNWTTGEVRVRALRIHLMGAAATAASPYAPWMLTFAIPAGAIAFWLRPRRPAEEPASPKAVSTPE